MLACYVVNTSSDDESGAKKCLPALEDYEECLHHRKEVCYAESVTNAGADKLSCRLVYAERRVRLVHAEIMMLCL